MSQVNSATPKPGESRQKTLLERMLSLVADVRQEEAAGALLMTLLMFLILAAYYELKTAREVFILTQGGAEVKSYSSAGQALLLLVLVPAYGAFASQVNRERLVTWVTLFFVGNVLLFALAYQAGLNIGIAYFLWVGIFNVMVIAQFWAFANDIFTAEQGKRLFPLDRRRQQPGCLGRLGARGHISWGRRAQCDCCSALPASSSSARCWLAS